MRLRNFFQYRRRFLSGIGIERDHHAARIAFQNRYDYFGANPQRSAYKIVLGEALSGCEVHIHVCSETPLIHRSARLFSQLFRRLQTKHRKGTTISHGALGPHQRELMLFIDVGSHHRHQSGIINTECSSVRRFNIDH